MSLRRKARGSALSRATRVTTRSKKPLILAAVGAGAGLAAAIKRRRSRADDGWDAMPSGASSDAYRPGDIDAGADVERSAEDASNATPPAAASAPPAETSQAATGESAASDTDENEESSAFGDDPVATEAGLLLGEDQGDRGSTEPSDAEVVDEPDDTDDTDDDAEREAYAASPLAGEDSGFALPEDEREDSEAEAGLEQSQSDTIAAGQEAAAEDARADDSASEEGPKALDRPDS